MSGWGYGFWSPTQNEEALRAHMESLDERDERMPKKRRWEQVAARWVLVLTLVATILWATAEFVA